MKGKSLLFILFGGLLILYKKVKHDNVVKLSQTSVFYFSEIISTFACNDTNSLVRK